MTKWTYYNGAGADSIWFTSDDVKAKDTYVNVAILEAVWSDNNNCASIGYDTDGTTILHHFTVKRDTVANTITYIKFQADGTTQDSAVVLDFTNNRMVSYSTAGTIAMYSTYTLNSSNEQLTLTFYNGAGADTLWLNDDDDVAMYSESTYDAGGYLAGTETYTDTSKDTRMGYSTVTH